MNKISFVLDGRIHEIAITDDSIYKPTTTVLNYLRSLPGHKGVKEGCAEGDCGACTVVLAGYGADGKMYYRAIDSCLVFLPMIHGYQLITVENLSQDRGHETELHPVQQALVDTNGTQCGYCTPGFVMSMFALYKADESPDRGEVLDALTGNLCRCTGYQPIIEATVKACNEKKSDAFTQQEAEVLNLLKSIRKEKETLHLKKGSQQWFKPFTLKAALELYAAHPDALLLSGATDLALRVTKKNEELETVIDLTSVCELKYTKTEAGVFLAGSGTTLEKLRKACKESLPALYKMLCVFGSRQIRNIATIGGNIGSASPIGDSLPVLMALGATVELQSIKGTREAPLDGFITGYRKTQIQQGEIITGIKVPLPASGSIIESYKISKRKDLDISTCSAGVKLRKDADGKVKEIVLAYGGMAAHTKRATTTENFLQGKPWTEETVEQAMEILYEEFAPISDARSGEEFRRLAARNLLMKFYNDTLK